jgi:hypothetical protein
VQQGATLRPPLSDSKETAGPSVFLTFVDFLGEFAKLFGLFVACLYL